MCMPRIFPRTRTGFTLIDIILVIATLSILAAILLPLFSHARQISYRTKCAGNLKQLGTAFTLYSNDWNGYLPCPGGRVGDRIYWSQSGRGGLVSYVNQQGRKSVWCCPLMPDWKSKYPVRSYSMNSYLREPPDLEYPTCTSEYFQKSINTSRINLPSRTILLFEGLPLTVGWENNGYYVYIYRCCNWTGVRGYYDKLAYTISPGEPWHGKLNNYLYCDGHIVCRPPGKKVGASYSSYKEMSEWYVDKAYFARTYEKYR